MHRWAWPEYLCYANGSTNVTVSLHHCNTVSPCVTMSLCHFVQGIALGSPYTDPATMYGSYADYAFRKKLISPSLHQQISHQFQNDCVPSLYSCSE